MTLLRVVWAAAGFLLGLALGLVPDLVLAAAEPAKPPDSAPSAMIFYLAKGRPDACGRGCDTWIAAEGKIDSEAAARLRAFLRQHKDPQLPLYLHSPGGDLRQAMAMGRLLRQRKAIARVSRTSVNECGSIPQTDDSCLKIKRSGRELAAAVPISQGAMCLSACPFVLFGATGREVAPDAVIGVHSPRITLVVRRGRPSEQMRDEATREGLERADRNMARYLAEMGIDHGLLDVTRTVKFESMRILTRDEIVRFGIDRREFAETPWSIDNGNRFARKLALEKKDGQDGYRILQWRLSCTSAEEFRLDYQRQTDPNKLVSTIGVSVTDSKPLYFKLPPFKSGGYELWTARLSAAFVQSVAAQSTLDLSETSFGPGGQRQVRVERLSTDGLMASVPDLLAFCRPVVNRKETPASEVKAPAASDFKARDAAAAGAAAR